MPKVFWRVGWFLKRSLATLIKESLSAISRLDCKIERLFNLFGSLWSEARFWVFASLKMMKKDTIWKLLNIKMTQTSHFDVSVHFTLARSNFVVPAYCGQGCHKDFTRKLQPIMVINLKVFTNPFSIILYKFQTTFNFWNGKGSGRVVFVETPTCNGNKFKSMLPILSPSFFINFFILTLMIC